MVIFYVFETESLYNVPLSVKLATLTFSENIMIEPQKFNYDDENLTAYLFS